MRVDSLFEQIKTSLPSHSIGPSSGTSVFPENFHIHILKWSTGTTHMGHILKLTYLIRLRTFWHPPQRSPTHPLEVYTRANPIKVGYILTIGSTIYIFLPSHPDHPLQPKPWPKRAEWSELERIWCSFWGSVFPWLQGILCLGCSCKCLLFPFWRVLPETHI